MKVKESPIRAENAVQIGQFLYQRIAHFECLPLEFFFGAGGSRAATIACDVLDPVMASEEKEM